MFDPKSIKQSKPKVAVIPEKHPAQLAMMANIVPPQDRIRERAYEMYESRGRQSGQDEQDWLRAERELLKQGK
jgi:DUF2934 family protein